MSLKKEIEKLIQAESAKLERGEQADKRYHDRQRSRFETMRVLLAELVASVDSAYLRASVDEDRATLEVGWRSSGSGYFNCSEEWKVEPNYEMSLRAKYSTFRDAPGIKVAETVHFPYEMECDDETNTHIFQNEEEAMTFLVGKIAKKVAAYRRQDRQKLKKS